MTVVRAAVPVPSGSTQALREFAIDTAARPAPPGPGTPTAISDAPTAAPVVTPAEVGGLRMCAVAGSVCNDAEVMVDEETGAFRHVGESSEAALRLFAERVGLPQGVQVHNCVRSTCVFGVAEE